MRDSKAWKILVGLYMIYSVTADLILLAGIAWLVFSGQGDLKMWNGEYCGIAAEITQDFETRYYNKIGAARGCLQKRCDAQRLKIVWGHQKPFKEGGARYDCEKEIQAIARRMFGNAKIDYYAAGYTESFGWWETVEEANAASFELLDVIKADPRFAHDEFWIHPRAIVPRGTRLILAA